MTFKSREKKDCLDRYRERSMVLRSKSKEIEEFDSLFPNFPWKNANLETLDREKKKVASIGIAEEPKFDFLFSKFSNFPSKNGEFVTFKSREKKDCLARYRRDGLGFEK